jgi:hypothetical protein
MLNLFTENSIERQGFVLSLDEITRKGARKMLSEALSSEVADYVAWHASLVLPA